MTSTVFTQNVLYFDPRRCYAISISESILLFSGARKITSGNVVYFLPDLSRSEGKGKLGLRVKLLFDCTHSVINLFLRRALELKVVRERLSHKTAMYSQIILIIQNVFIVFHYFKRLQRRNILLLKLAAYLHF